MSGSAYTLRVVVWRPVPPSVVAAKLTARPGAPAPVSENLIDPNDDELRLMTMVRVMRSPGLTTMVLGSSGVS